MKSRQRSNGLLIAVSGGADSTALALLATRTDPLQDANGGAIGPIALAHVQHGFRRAAAAEELAQLQELSRRLGAPLHVLELAPPPGWREGAKIPEAWARAARYRALASLAARLGLATLATAHHAGDRRETQLLHLLRGGGLRALAGIVPLRRLPSEGGALEDGGGPRLWRPLLDREPEELRALLREHGLPWSEDASNRDLRLARNRIRHALVPALARAGDPLLARADRLARLAQRAVARIDAACDRLLDEALPAAREHCLLLPLPRLRRLAPSLWRELLARAALRLLPANAPPAGLRRRRGELRETIDWLQRPLAAGERRIGDLGLQRSSHWLALFRVDATPGLRWSSVAGARTGGQVGWFAANAVVAVRTLAVGDRLKEVASRLLPVERRAWPAVFVDGKVAWVPGLRVSDAVSLTALSDPGSSPAPAAPGQAITILGLPDLRERAAALTRARTDSSRRSRSESRRHGSSAA